MPADSLEVSGAGEAPLGIRRGMTTEWKLAQSVWQDHITTCKIYYWALRTFLYTNKTCSQALWSQIQSKHSSFPDGKKSSHKGPGKKLQVTEKTYSAACISASNYPQICDCDFSLALCESEIINLPLGRDVIPQGWLTKLLLPNKLQPPAVNRQSC